MLFLILKRLQTVYRLIHFFQIALESPQKYSNIQILLCKDKVLLKLVITKMCQCNIIKFIIS